MQLKLDLHIHSAQSPDGRMSVEEIVSLCRSRGLNGAAVCDHDHVFAGKTDFPDFLLIPGVEVSTQFGHLLGLFVSQPVDTRDFYTAVERIHAQGGVAVLAHPFQHSREEARLTPIAHLLDGIEVFNSRADRKHQNANAMAAKFAKTHGLAPFAGSDAHVPQEIGNVVLTLEVADDRPETVKAALLSGQSHITGRNSPARYTAMSQLTKKRKTGASIPAYLKWVLFALQCCARDLIKGE